MSPPEIIIFAILLTQHCFIVITALLQIAVVQQRYLLRLQSVTGRFLKFKYGSRLKITHRQNL